MAYESRPSPARSRRSVISLLVALGTLALPASAPAQAEHFTFFEETADANWSVPYSQCADGSTVQGRLLVRSTYDFESPDTEDANPTARVQFLAVCEDGGRSAGESARLR